MADLVAKVLKAGIEAATLKAAQGRITFEYLPEYLESDKPAVATTLPKTSQAITTESGATPAFFAGLLPEGRRLNAIAARIKTSIDNELRLLLELGTDTVGDVQIVSDLDQSKKSTAIRIPKDTSKLDLEKLRSEYFDSAAAGLPGFQDKISSRMLNAPARKQGLEYILKFNPQEAPFAVENEYYFLRQANRVGIKTAEFELLTDSEGKHALSLQRFDRRVVNGETERLAMEDACQVLNLYPASKYDLGFEEVARSLISHCSAKKVAALELFRVLVFNYLIGNGDAHAKNFSILRIDESEWRISPAYDLLCTRYYEDSSMALTLDGQDHGWTRDLVLNFAQEFGIPKNLAERELNSMLQKLGSMPQEIELGALPFRRDQNFDVVKLMKSRFRALSQ